MHKAKQKREVFTMTTEQIIKILRQKKEYFKEKYGVKKSPYLAPVLMETIQWKIKENYYFL